MLCAKNGMLLPTNKKLYRIV